MHFRDNYHITAHNLENIALLTELFVASLWHLRFSTKLSKQVRWRES